MPPGVPGIPKGAAVPMAFIPWVPWVKLVPVGDSLRWFLKDHGRFPWVRLRKSNSGNITLDAYFVDWPYSLHVWPLPRLAKWPDMDAKA